MESFRLEVEILKLDKAECPMPGNCYQPNVVYRADITTPGGNLETYTGATKEFHGRWLAHRRSYTNPAVNKTTFSSYIWSLKDANTPFNIQWSIIDRAPPYNPRTGLCMLCTVEKYHILFEPGGATLNQRDEFFSPCYHKKSQLLVNQN